MVSRLSALVLVPLLHWVVGLVSMGFPTDESSPYWPVVFHRHHRNHFVVVDLDEFDRRLRNDPVERRTSSDQRLLGQAVSAVDSVVVPIVGRHPSGWRMIDQSTVHQRFEGSPMNVEALEERRHIDIQIPDSIWPWKTDLLADHSMPIACKYPYHFHGHLWWSVSHVCSVDRSS